MKRYYLLLFALLGVCLMGGCQDKEEPAPDSVYMFSTSGSVNADGGERSVTIFTTRAWTAESKAGWITVDPVSGGEKGIHVVKLKYGANPGSSERPGEVVFTAGTYEETFTLNQKGQ